MLYEDKGNTQIYEYCGDDWAGSPTNKCSSTRYCVFLIGNIISWKSSCPINN